MDDNDWGPSRPGHRKAPRRPRHGLRRPRAYAITWSYGGASGQNCATRVHINIDVSQGEDLAAAVTHNNWPPGEWRSRSGWTP